MSKECIDCNKRLVGCHDNCEDYLEYKKISEKARRERNEEFEYKDYISNRLWRERKYKNKGMVLGEEETMEKTN